ncbi:MAG: ribokinase [Henriciella sp.]|nr:ribokinase [Henriciella sp.]
MSVRIGIVGSINLDLVASGAPLPAPGETVTGASFARHPGGKGANQALAARRLGADVTMVGCVGDDGLAESALSILRAEGVDLTGVETVKDQATGVALIAVSPDGENQIIVASGANACVSERLVSKMPDCDAILCQLEVPIDAVMAAFERSKGLFAVNLAPAMDVPDQLLAEADLIIVNGGEAAFYGEKLLQNKGRVVVTLGKDGAMLYENGKVAGSAPAFDVTAVDTTGAGDTFSAALVVALAEGQDPESALRFASAAAALAVTKAGAQPSLPTRSEVETLLAKP